jgi:hypothetical protein
MKKISVKDLVLEGRALQEKFATVSKKEEDVMDENAPMVLNLQTEADEDGLSKVLNLRLSYKQFEELQNKAESSKTTLSDFVRSSLFDK